MATRVYCRSSQGGMWREKKSHSPCRLLTNLSARVYCRSGQEEKRGAQNTTRYSGRLPACAMADKAAIYYLGLTGLAPRQRGGKPLNWDFVAPAKGEAGCSKHPHPLPAAY